MANFKGVCKVIFLPDFSGNHAGFSDSGFYLKLSPDVNIF